jgi:hypothetical protein
MRWVPLWFVLASAGWAADRLSVSSTTIISPDGAATLGSPGLTVAAPPPLAATGPLSMSEIPAVSRPAGFVLTDAAGRTFGPFAFKEGARVGAASAPYTLELTRDGTFSLIDPRSRTSFGPFAATNGAPVTVGRTALAFARLPGSLRIQLSHRGAVGTTPLVAAGELTPALQAALYELRNGLVDVANRLAFETASVTIENQPTIITPSGHRYTPTVRKSLRDRESARRAADLAATALLETFARANLRVPLARDPDGGYRLQPTPSGACLVCALWRVKDEDAITTAASRTVVWWTPVAAEPMADVQLNLNDDCAGDWRSVFRLPPLRD